MDARAGDEHVLFIHSTGTGPSLWAGVPDAAIGGRKKLLPSNIGYPPNAPVERGRTVTAKDDAAEIVRAVPSDARRVHLVAHSYGGLVALHALPALGDRVASMFLYEPVLFGALARSTNTGTNARASAAAETEAEVEAAAETEAEVEAAAEPEAEVEAAAEPEAEVEAAAEPEAEAEAAAAAAAAEQARSFDAHPWFLRDAEKGGREEWLEMFVDYWNRPGSWSKMPQPVRELSLALGWKMFQEVRACFFEATPFEAWHVTVPTTVAVGERTTLASRAMSRAFARAHEKASLVEIPGVGHMAPLTQAAKVHDELARHFTRVDGRGQPFAAHSAEEGR